MSNRILAATRKGLFTLERGRKSWAIAAAEFLGDNVSMVLPDPSDGALYAALDLGHFGVKVHRRDRGAAAWSEVAAPAFDPQPEAAENAPAVKMIWSLESGGPDRPGVLWAGTLPGALFRSADRGDSWQLNRPLWDRPERKQWLGGGYSVPGIHSICVDPRDSRHVAVGVSCGGVWWSGDDGETWDVRARGMFAAYMPPERREDPVIQDPHRLAVCPSEPDTWWVQHHNGVFRTTDAGRQWTEIDRATPSVFGFAVAAHPEQPGTAWFVPAVKDECRVPVGGAVVVARTRDGGGSFEVLTEGLPQRHAYDLVLRHALDVDGSGERLAFGSTTGSLWISEDAGDRWEAVSHHLPPIYAVRFA